MATTALPAIRFNPGGSGMPLDDSMFGRAGGQGSGLPGQPKGSSNQFFSTLPSLPNPQSSTSPTIATQGAPGTVPQSSTGLTIPNKPTGLSNVGDGFLQVNPQFPNLSQGFADFLKQFMGQGATPFDLQALLPSGGTTGAGQLSAPENDIMQQLQQFFSGNTGGQSKIPGLQTLSDVATKGIDAVPTWQKMVDAMERNVGENAANLKEQFAQGGGLVGTPYGNAMGDFYSQTSKDQSALLGGMEFEGIQTQMAAASQLAQMGGDVGQFLQGLDQSSIDRLYNEFLRTQPEYNPLLGITAGMATTFPPMLGKDYGLGGVGALLQGAGTLASGIGQGIGAAGGDKAQPTPVTK